MIYFDNAATSYFKPSAVVDACSQIVFGGSANPGRSGHRLSLSGAKIIYTCRQTLARTFNSNYPERIIFTKNCTEALNVAIFGTLEKGDHVIASIYEHNSVLRPLYYLQNKKFIKLTIVEPNKNGGFLPAIKKEINKKTALVCITAMSNVNGNKTDFREIGNHLKNTKIIFLVDGAQAGGHLKIDMQKDGIDILCLAGHKGLCGIMGSGVLAFNNKVEIAPLTFGGTGTETFNKNQPSIYPEKLESGTLNLPAVASLLEGVKYVNKNLSRFGELLEKNTDILIGELQKNDKIKLYSKPNAGGIVAFSMKDVDSTELADRLNVEFDIAVRGGFHCAPLAHKFLKTDKNGLVRVSLAPQNTVHEIYRFIDAINQITSF